MAIAIGAVFLLGVVDYATGFELSFSFFYLIPISIIAWAISRNAGLGISVLSATVWLISNLLSGEVLSHAAIGVWNTLIRFSFYGVVTILLDELRGLLEAERVLAGTDPLTGVLNRRSFNEITEKKMMVAKVNERPFTLAYIDLDNFKTINDTFGHATGDLALKVVVDTVQTLIRNTDFLARLGGDEFAILLMDIDQEQARQIVQRLQSSLLDQMKENGWDITFSIGALTVQGEFESTEKLVNLADTLMYEVKTKGKNAIHFSTFEG